MTTTRRAPAVVAIARIAFPAGLLATALALWLTFVPLVLLVVSGLGLLAWRARGEEREDSS